MSCPPACLTIGYSLLHDVRAIANIRRQCIYACLEAMTAEVRFTYTDCLLK